MELSYYKARTTLLEMCRDRGYSYKKQGSDIIEKDVDLLTKFYLSPDEFKQLFKKSANRDPETGTMPTSLDIYDIVDKKGKPVYIRILRDIFKDPKHFKVFDKSKNIRSDLIPVAEHFGISIEDSEDLQQKLNKIHIILVYQSPQKKDNKYDLNVDTHFLVNPNIDAIPIHRLTFNVTKHILVNQHRILTDSEKNILIEKFNANIKMFNKIYLDDPVNIYYGGKPGDMYEISRKGFKPSYRIVVSKIVPRKK